jgi:glycosyltransferase involved in cell wall biosynthesis
LASSLDPKLLSDLPEGLEILRTPSGQPFWLFRLFAKLRLEYLRDLLYVSSHGPDTAFSWNRRAVRAALALSRRKQIDAIYVSLRPFSSAFIGTRLKRLIGVPVVLDFRDPWTQYFLATFPTWLHYKVSQWLEKSAVRQADHVITITPTARTNLLKWCSFLSPDKVTCITNGFCEEEFSVPAESQPRDDVFRILYSGNFCGGPEDKPVASRNAIEWAWRTLRRTLEYTPRRFDRVAHSPRFLLDAMSELVAEDPSLRKRLRFVHIGPSGPSHVQYVRKLGLEECVEFCGFVPHAEAVERMLAANALFFCLADSPTGERNDCIPQKAFEYIASGKPVLALSPPGDATELFERTGVAEICPPRDIPAIKTAIRRLMSGSRAYTPNEAVRETYGRRQLTSRLVHILDGLVASNGENVNSLAVGCRLPHSS